MASPRCIYIYSRAYSDRKDKHMMLRNSNSAFPDLPSDAESPSITILWVLTLFLSPRTIAVERCFGKSAIRPHDAGYVP